MFLEEHSSETLGAEKGEVGTVREAIDRMARARGDAVFLISPESRRVLSFAGLQEESRTIAAGLREAGLEPGDKVAFLLENGLFTVQLFLGTMYEGLVSVPLNVRAGASQLAYTLDHCDAKVVFVEERYKALAQEALAGCSRAVKMLAAEIDAFATDSGAWIGDRSLHQSAAEDVALLMYTSGSAGQPKAAIHTNRTVLAHGRNSARSHQLTPADRSLLVLPLYHINAECVTLMPALLSGGSVVVPHHFSVSEFWDLIDEYHCSWSAVVPTIIAQLVDWQDPHAGQRQAAFQRIRFLRSSSAPLSPSLQREFMEKFPLRLIQAMGSSEAGNIFSNPQAPGTNKIGSPGLVWGFETRIVGSEGAEVGAGESGEVLIRGDGLTQGYYKDAEQSAAVFDADGWMHTGDLAYQDADGYFFVVGRSKELIIKGGVNIAPRQIDEVLESHPAVLEAAVVGVPDRYVGEDLVAFAVLRSRMEADERELRTYCESRLGHFKTPTRVYFLTDLPKGPSGKVQRLRLLTEAAQLSTAGSAANGKVAQHASPSAVGTIAQAIAHSWAEVLGQPQVGADINFFALGGHSLMALQCLALMHERLPITLTLADFFEHPTVAQQVALVTERLVGFGHNGYHAAGEAASCASEPVCGLPVEALAQRLPVLARGKSLRYPLSSGQQRIWFFEELAPEVPLYNESEAVRLIGELHADVLERALNLIIERHEMLRSTIQLESERPIGIVHSEWLLWIKRLDLSAMTPDQRAAEAARLLIDEPRRRYHLEVEPGIRATLIRLGPSEHVFILMMHHMVCDWASEGVLWRELSLAYHALAHNVTPCTEPLPIQYGDYATWQHQRLDAEGFAEDLAFWEDNLRGAPELLELPSDRPRPSVQSYSGGRQRFRLNPGLTRALRNCSRQENTSLFTVFTAALNTLIYRYTGSADILIGIPIAEREHPKLQAVIGFLIHTQALRTKLAGNLQFRELLTRVQKGFLALYRHREAPFDQVVRRLRPERSLSHAPLFQVMINWRDQANHLSFVGLDGLVVESLLAETRTAKFDLTLFLTDFGSEIWMEAEYNTDLFDDDRIARMFGHYQTVLEAVAADAGSRLAEIPLLTKAEREQLLLEWNATEVCYPRNLCIHQLFELQAERTPDAIAVVFGEQAITYDELNQRSNRLAHYLRDRGVKPDDLVAISVERSAGMVVGLLGILKAGAAYVPLDPNYPRERLAFMLADSGAAMLLTQERLLERLPEHAAQAVCLDREGPQIAQHSGHNPSSNVSSGNLAYVIYTSGSTGQPKGVEIAHCSVVNLLCAMRNEPGLSAADTLLAVTSVSFDMSVVELFLPLAVGAKLFIASREAITDGGALLELLQTSRATVIQATPITFRMLLEAGWNGRSALKVVSGGEALPRDLAGQIMEHTGELWNYYGPTEATVYSSGVKVTANGSITIGRPIANTQLYILDANGQPCPIGQPGELHIGGDGCARGYFMRPELTAERFIADPFSGKSGARMYRTGDLARYLADGTVEYLGRIDQQVKIHGYRIELGEIESALMQHPGIRHCVAAAREDQAGDKRLVAYLVPFDRFVVLTTEALRDWLKAKLPEYMVPAAFVVLEELPLTANGKLDRKALPAPELAELSSRPAYVAPRTALEEALAGIWRAVLGLKQIGIHDDFFALGGHSLQATQLLTRVHKALGYRLPVALFFHQPTVAGMARSIEGNPTLNLADTRISSSSNIVPIRSEGSTPPLFLLHGIGGRILGFYELIRHLEPGQRVYGVEYAFNDPAPARLSLEALAARYVEEIRKVQPQGPYYLLGYSFGGMLAFEMAQQLTATGQAIGLLGMVDSHPFLSNSTKPHDASHSLVRTVSRRLRALNYRTQRMIWEPNRLRYIRDEGSIKAGNLAARCRSLVYAALNAGGRPIPKVIENAYAVNWFAASRYQASRYPGRVTLFRAALGEPDFGERYGYERGWKPLAGGGVEVHEIAGSHLEVMHEPNVQELAHQVTACLSVCYCR